MALCVPLLVTPVLPLIDFYNHVARYFVLSHLGEIATIDANYTANWQLLPNMGMDLIGTGLLEVAPATVAAKLIIGALLAIQLGGLLFLCRSLGSRSALPTALLGVALLYSYILNWGFANFLLAIGLSLWAMGAWIRLRDRPPLAILAGAAFGVAIMLTHGFAFALYGATLAGIEIGCWRASRRPTGALLRGLLALLATAVLPAILFFLSATSGGEAGVLPTGHVLEHLQRGSLGHRLWLEFLHRIETIVRVAESPWPLADALLFIAAAAVVGGGLWSGALRSDRRLWPALAILAVAAVVTPPAMFGVGFVSDRVPFLFMLIFAASLDRGEREWRLRQPVMAGLVALAVARILVVSAGWATYARDYADYQALMRHVPEGAFIYPVFAFERPLRDGGLRRCQMWNALAVPQHGVVTPLFADARMQPIALKGRLLDATRARPSGPYLYADVPPGFYERYLRQLAASGQFDYLLVCGADWLPRPLPGEVARRGQLTLLKLPGKGKAQRSQVVAG